jgi:hypothetical protein
VAPRRSRETITGKLKPADPFELIRWLARSQPDPRKALAELVQNSLDAGARMIRVTRLREHGVAAIHVLDDGEGVIPHLGRAEALTYIATHVGHSLKRNLTPEQRRELMTQGKYGVGLLGFWAIGQVLEMRTQLPNQPAHLLRLYEDSPKFEIERVRSRLSLGERFTEVVIRGLHRPAFLSLGARRIADYLAAELRGQLLARDVQVLVHDRIARGRAPKVLEVRPARFEGERLLLPELIVAEGFAPIRVELYVRSSAQGEGEGVAVLCAGTVVYDAVTQFEAADFCHPPWTDPRLTGMIDFPDFEVPPGARRGVVPNLAAHSFASALAKLEPAVASGLGEADRRAAAEVDADVMRQLERAFRDLRRLAPEYDFFALRSTGAEVRGAVAAERGNGGAAPAPDSLAPEVTSGIALGEDSGEPQEPATLLPPGPLETLQVVPSETRVERLGERRFRAIARDANGTRLRAAVAVRWRALPPLGYVIPEDGETTVFRAGGEIGTLQIVAEARQGERIARGESSVEVVDVLPSVDGSRAGIPEPVLVDEPSSPWRSRVSEDRWEVNGGHPDFRVASQSPRRKLRYLATLLAKEIVLHSFPAPQLGPALERLVGVLAITDRRLERS